MSLHAVSMVSDRMSSAPMQSLQNLQNLQTQQTRNLQTVTPNLQTLPNLQTPQLPASHRNDSKLSDSSFGLGFSSTSSWTPWKTPLSRPFPRIPPEIGSSPTFMGRRDTLLELISASTRLLDDFSNINSMQPGGICVPPLSSSLQSSISSVEGDADLAINHDPSTLSILTFDSKTDFYQSKSSSSSSSHESTSNAKPSKNAKTPFATAVDAKLVSVSNHLRKLHARLSDKSSKILITGDLNAGKSSLVNALLRKNVVPQDQQPCTAVFCEVIDSKINNNIDAVHAITIPSAYNRTDPSTFKLFDLCHLNQIVMDDHTEFAMLKVYCKDGRVPDSPDSKTPESLLHNGLIDISLIDSPGLNIDFNKTMSLFNTQEEIDVVVFVVHAENQFTLSSKEFLEAAGREKAFVFMVINRFDMIEDKERCRKFVMDQVKTISPKTWENKEQLVHFVSAKECLNAPSEDLVPADFRNLEAKLRDFILANRERSKLFPAKVYLSNLLSDMIILTRHNLIISNEKIHSLDDSLSSSSPHHERLLFIKSEILESVDTTIENSVSKTQTITQTAIAHVIDELDTITAELHHEYTGIFGAWSFATFVKEELWKNLLGRVAQCEGIAKDDARKYLEGLLRVGESVDIQWSEDDLKKWKQVFEMEYGSEVVVLSPHAPHLELIELKKPVEPLTVEMADFFDYEDKIEVVKEYVPSLFMVFGGLVGYQRVATGLLNVGSSMIGNVNTGRIVSLGVAAAGAGIFFYILTDLPRTITRKITRKMRRHLHALDFTATHTDRITRGTRRVLRMGLWHFQLKFQTILEESTAKRNSEIKELHDWNALRSVFKDVREEATGLRVALERVDLEPPKKY